jgi:hypothetical protein
MDGSLFPGITGAEPRASPPCPFCDGTDTRMLSSFGGQLSVAQCWCNRCRTGFEYLKWEAKAERARRDGG